MKTNKEKSSIKIMVLLPIIISVLALGVSVLEYLNNIKQNEKLKTLEFNNINLKNDIHNQSIIIKSINQSIDNSRNETKQNNNNGDNIGHDKNTNF
jgi:hypothetical protein